MKFIKKFVSDGCSCFPDGNYRNCCVTHDMAYYKGGTALDRKKADLKLLNCVECKRKVIRSYIMYVGVRLFGVPWLPTPFRWGFGRAFKDSFWYDKK